MLPIIRTLEVYCIIFWTMCLNIGHYFNTVHLCNKGQVSLTWRKNEWRS